MSTHFRNQTRFGIAASLALALASCGGGGSGEGAVPPPGGNPPPSTVNRAPVLMLPNDNMAAMYLHAFSFDVSQNGRTFTDPDGDPLRYEIRLGHSTTPDPNPPRGLRVEGTRVVGAPEEVGTVVVEVIVFDPAGLSNSHQFHIFVAANGNPVVVNAPDDVNVSVNQDVNIDTRAGGATFADPNGDPLTYSISLRGAPGFVVNGTRVVGRLATVGLVEVKVTASDGSGGSQSDVFLIAAPATAIATPTLPTTAYTYQDELLPLPMVFRMSSQSIGQLWDRQSPDNRTTDAGAALGRVLFHDKRLSITNTHACASCHEQSHGFATPQRFDTGALGVPLRRNSMALANARYNIHSRWFLDMRANSLQEVARQALQNPEELGSTLSLVETKLRATPFYAGLFTAAFGSSEITSDRILRALEQYVQALISYRSKFDGVCTPITSQPSCPNTLDAIEMRGFELFMGDGGQSCQLCHNLPAGNNVWQANNGLDLIVADTGVQSPGLMQNSGEGVFRPAALRNLAFTAPYMHDGRFATLREVIDHYDHDVKDTIHLDSIMRNVNGGVRRMDLSEADKNALEAFLRTLTDDEMIADPKFADPFQ